jgi:hypothetical protein
MIESLQGSAGANRGGVGAPYDDGPAVQLRWCASRSTAGRNADAAWFYPDASEKANPIEGYVAFWRGVTVER